MTSQTIEKKIAAISWSGGKDCNLALHHALCDPSLDVRYLVVFRPDGDDDRPFRAHPLSVMERQAESIGLPLLHVLIPNDTADYQAEYVRGLMDLHRRRGVRVVVTGDMDLVGTMDRGWMERCCEAVTPAGAMSARSPLWGRDRISCLEEMLALNFELVFTCVKTPFFDETWINRRLDRETLEEMKSIANAELTDEKLASGVKPLDLCGERGEYHTMCLNGPHYRRRISLDVDDRVDGEEFERQEVSTNWKGNVHNATTIFFVKLKEVVG